MDYRTLGNTALKVSAFCLGCMGFGDAQQGMHKWTLPYEESREIMAKALETGINFFDTAMGYQGGTSEVYVGRALKELTQRDKVVVATKFTPRTEAEKVQGITGQEHIRNCLDGSLKRLGLDYIDLYICHMWDYGTPIEEILEGLHNAIVAGKIRYIGISNCFAYQLERANRIAEANGWETFASVQGHYNLLFREEEREMARLCAEENIAMTPYSALASGRLSKRPGETSKRLEMDAFAKGKYDATKEADEVIIRRVMEIADRHEVSMTEVALAWLLRKVTSPVVGATKPHHLEGPAKACDLHLTDDEMTYLEEMYVPHALVGVMATNGK